MAPYPLELAPLWEIPDLSLVTSKRYDHLNISVADVHSKILDAPGPVFFIFMKFLANFGQIIGWRPLWEILDLTLHLSKNLTG